MRQAEEVRNSAPWQRLMSRREDVRADKARGFLDELRSDYDEFKLNRMAEPMPGEEVTKTAVRKPPTREELLEFMSPKYDPQAAASRERFQRMTPEEWDRFYKHDPVPPREAPPKPAGPQKAKPDTGAKGFELGSEPPAEASAKTPKYRSKAEAFRAIKDAAGIDDYDSAQADAAYRAWKAKKGPKPPPFEGGHFDEINQLLDLKGNKRVSGAEEAFDLLMKGKKGWGGVEEIISKIQRVKGLSKVRLPDDVQDAMLPGKDPSFNFGANAKPKGDERGFLDLGALRDLIEPPPPNMTPEQARTALANLARGKFAMRRGLGALGSSLGGVKGGFAGEAIIPAIDLVGAGGQMLTRAGKRLPYRIPLEQELLIAEERARR